MSNLWGALITLGVTYNAIVATLNLLSEKNRENYAKAIVHYVSEADMRRRKKNHEQQKERE